MLAYGSAADSIDEYLKLARSTALECLEKFCEGIIHCYEEEFCRRPNVADIQRLLAKAEERGFPGMLGSIDCMHWQWRNCPVAHAGQFTRGDIQMDNEMTDTSMYTQLLNDLVEYVWGHNNH